MRRLEHNGLMARQVIASPSMMVAYSLTLLGRSLQNPSASIYEYMLEDVSDIE